jgi:hypothetical protein
MSGNTSRNKGRSGELALKRLIHDWTGWDVQRNLLQTRDAGHDLTGIPDGWCVECKLHKSYSGKWFEQAVAQAESVEGGKPVVIYRLTGTKAGQHDLDKWQCETWAHLLIPRLSSNNTCRVTIPLRAWLQYVQETVGDTC